MKQNLFIFLISIGGLLSSVAQTERISFKNEDINQYLLSKDVFTIPNFETGELLFLLGDKNDLWVYKYDRNYKKVLDFKINNDVHGVFTKLIGYRIIGDRYDLVTANESLNKIELFTLDIAEGVLTKEDNIDFKFSKEEKFLQSFQLENSLYFLSSNDQSTLYIRKLGDNREFELLKEFELNNFANQGMSISLKELFPSFWDSFWQKGVYLKPSNKANIPTIVYGTPNPRHIITDRTKLYQDGSLIHLVGDLENGLTVIQTIDLINLTGNQYVIPYLEDKKERFSDHNSYLYKNTLFQINASKEAMILQVKNLKGEVINEITLHDREQKIGFANPPNIIEGHSFYSRNKKLYGAKKFLKNLAFGNIGLNVFSSNNTYALQIGNYYESNGNASFGSNTGELNAPHQKSKYINTFLDEEFQNEEEDANPFQIDLYRDYQYNMRYKVSSYTFSNNGSIFLLYYNHPSEELKLIEF